MNQRTILEIACKYIDQGWSIIPVGYKTKGDLPKGWPDIRINRNNLPQYFNGQPQNIGGLLGQASKGLTDVDFDCKEAIDLAGSFLPQTVSFGRESVRYSHALYYTDLATKGLGSVIPFDDPKLAKDPNTKDRARLFEVRIGGEKGAQTVLPGSVHPSGEPVQWEQSDHVEPVWIDGDDLLKQARVLAAACLLVRYYPAKGNRHDVALTIGGFLSRCDFTEHQIKVFLGAIAIVAKDDELKDRIKAGTDALAHYEATGQARGHPKFAETFSKEVAKAVAEWLGYKFTEQGTTAMPERPWPVMGADAFYGYPGYFVKLIDPESEADPVAILLQLLVAVGNVVGRKRYHQVESDKHYTNEYMVLVGETSSGKGVGWGRVRTLVESADPGWTAKNIRSGLGSGEGIINAVRDSRDEWNPKKNVTEQIPGVDDKRLMIVETEFAAMLAVMSRFGNTISQIIRKMWDGERIETLVKNNPIWATNAHGSIIGHITPDELRAKLTQTDMVNGFVNRFLLALVKHSKDLPDGGNPIDMQEVTKWLKEILNTVFPSQITRTEEARKHWHEIYGGLKKPRLGMIGAVTARARPHVLRLSIIYAILDKSLQIDVQHQKAALAVWKYCEESAAYLFGDSVGDETADNILRVVRNAGPSGISRSDLSRTVFGSSSTKGYPIALDLLLRLILIGTTIVPSTGGRPTEVFIAKG